MKAENVVMPCQGRVTHVAAATDHTLLVIDNKEVGVYPSIISSIHSWAGVQVLSSEVPEGGSG